MAIDRDPREQADSPIRAFLVSDVRLYREGVQAALARRETIAVVGTASSIADALDRAAAADPDVVIVDVATRDSLRGIATLAAAMPTRKIVAFAVDEQSCDVATYAEAGIAGYVPCDASIDDLAAALATVARGHALCSPRVAGSLFRRLAAHGSRPAPDTALSALSPREREILSLIRGGMSNKDIARALTIEIATVKNHVHSVLSKLNVLTRAEAAALDRRLPERRRA